MASSGFRQPQFSEDMAWLPPWLQPNQERVLDEPIKDVQTTYQQAYKDLVPLERNANLEKDVVLLTSEEARYNNCHLFLSGDDNTSVGTTESSGNQFLHFRLHLSSDGISQRTPSPHCNFHQADRHKSSDVLPKQPLAETSTCTEKAICQQKMAINDDFVNDPVTPKSGMPLNSRAEPLTNDKNHRFGKHEETGDCRSLINSDIEDAIELSIAASEALAISVTAKTDSASEILPASAILDVALRMKQARNCLCLNSLEAVSDYVTDEADETDLLLDLDEGIMSDAFEDVGLSIRQLVGNFDDLWGSSSLIKQSCSLSGTLSRVLDTPISVNCGLDNEFQNVELRAEKVDLDGVSSPMNSEYVQATDSQFLKDKPSECGVFKKKPFGGHCASILSPERFLKSQLNHSDQEKSKATTQAIDMCTVDIFSNHTPFSPPQVQHSRKNAGVNKLVHADRFNSRWLGGWTSWSTKDVDVLLPVDETNVITESEDITNDNSLVKELEVEPKIASLSWKPCEGPCSAVNKGIILSQDFETSSDLSLADPLCSVVPCSISLDNANGLSSNDKNVEVGKCSSPSIKHGLEKSHGKITGSCAEFAHADETAVVKSNSATYGATTRRKSISLRKYSTLLPQNIGSERMGVYFSGSLSKLDILGLLSSEEIVDCNNSSSKEDSVRLIFPKPTSEASAGKECEKDHETSSIEEPIINSTNPKRRSDETAENEGKMQFNLGDKSCSPQILNYGIRRRLQASKNVFYDDIGDVSGGVSVPIMVKTQNISTCVDQSKIAENPSQHTSKHQKPCMDPSASRKRVHFSEDGINKFQQSMSGQKYGNENCSITRAGKRVRRLSLQSDLRTQGVTACRTNSCRKERRKMIFQGLEFLLTGFSSQKEKELEMLIRKQGGFVLSDVPPPPNLRGNRKSRRKLQQLPIVLSPKKLQTSKFLYGCAVNAFLLKASWLTDSSIAGSALPPDQYMLLPIRDYMKHKIIGRPVCFDNLTNIFYKVGVMLHGKHSFWVKFGKIIKHGGGQVFKTLQWLVLGLRNGKISMAVIVAEDKGRASRHLKQCAIEQKLPMMPATWIINSLYVGKLLPFEENCPSFPLSAIKIREFTMSNDLSEEI